jgi:serine/threonine-protein kinase
MELLGRRFGHIRITDVAGQGGMGDVYVGYDEKLDRKVALKALHADHRLDAEARERLLREARTLSKVDHPHICRIHDYIESSDVDLLVLEYIDGQTLQEAVEQGRLSRAEKLRIALAIADVLVAAHRAGIIHRDLKPENVMLTKKDEVKVLDFGLARWLTVRSSSKRLRAVSAAEMESAIAIADEANNVWFPVSDSSATVLNQTRKNAAVKHFHRTEAGVTMGTPLYMSPEQARGEELTVASDMYSYGLVLQFLFTAADPHPIGLTAREVILRAARGEKVAADGVPGDAAALITRLTQFAPADRPTAIETTARLKFLIDRPRRLVRRAAIAVAALLIIFASWRYTSDLARERTAAVDARAEAESRRAQAENLIEFMLGDLREKLVPVGRLDILDDVGERALQYVGSLKPENLSSEELARNSKALNQLGEVRIAQGKLDEALRIFERSRALSEFGAKREPSSAPAQLAAATSHFWIGNVYQLKGALPDALRHYTTYMTTAELLARNDPANDDYQLERAYSHGNVGTILEMQGDLRGALNHYRTSFDIKNARLQRNPADAKARAEVARAVNKVGGLQMRLGDLAGARTQFENEVATHRQLLRADPQQMTWKRRLASSLAYLAVVRSALGDTNGAIACAEEELGIDRELATRDPQNVEWQHNLALASWRVADLLVHRDPRRALEHASQADTTIRSAIASTPGRKDWINERLGIDTTYARLIALSGQRGRAESMLLSNIEQLQSAVDADAQARLGEAWFELGELQRERANRAAAMKSWTKAYEAMREIGPSTMATRPASVWVRILARLGRIEESRSARGKLREMGYQSPDLEQVCREEGC